MDNYIHFINISKKFGAVQVLHDIDFSIKESEVHAFLGENGAGKSTLLNILHGIYQEYDGEIKINNELVKFNSVFEANEFGISKVHQEICLVDDLTVTQNIMLGQEMEKGPFVDIDSSNDACEEILNELGCNFHCTDKVSNLTAGQKQMVLVAKALYSKAKVISFDEPTSALSLSETEHFFKIIEKLKKDGVTIIYVSHRINEIFTICDRVSVFMDGRYVKTYDVSSVTKDELVKSMVGREVNLFQNSKIDNHVMKEVSLNVSGLSLDNIYKDINFTVKKGEIFGLYGLVGSKRTDVVRTIFGAEGGNYSGDIFINGNLIKVNSPRVAIKNGIGLVPEERKSQGFIRVFKNYENVVLPSISKFIKSLIINNHLAKVSATNFMNELNVNPKDPEKLTINLSGGNQQKIVIAKWLHNDSDILILDEPTKGVDVGAKEEIYETLFNLAKEGKTIIVVSSDLPEVVGICDSVLVMSEGQQKAILTENEITEENILKYALGEYL